MTTYKNQMTMNILNNRNQRTSIFKTAALCLLGVLSLAFVSCDDDMDFQQSYPFTVETMSMPGKVTNGETVEIRCEKKDRRLRQYAYHQVFPFEGKGTLKMDNDITFLPNNRYYSKTRSSACTTTRNVTKRKTLSWW